MITLKTIIHAVDVPLACTFLASGVLLSILTNFPQFRKIQEFIKILRLKKSQEATANTLSPLHALYTAMSTSLGMGNIISPAIAVSIGGPGALFWMAVYALFGSVTKFTEVVFAVKYKRYAKDGTIIGGPTGYLYHIHPIMANWYGILSIFLFSAWSALQSKTLAVTYAHYGVAEYISGALLATFVFCMLMSGTKTIGNFASKMVPFLFVFYLCTAFTIIFSNIAGLKMALAAIFAHAFAPAAAVGGFAGASMMVGLRQGIFKGAFTTEAGVGTAAIPHSYSSTDNPIQQGILGMYSIFMNTFLCMVSGIVAIITGVWSTGNTSNDLAFLAFKKAMPHFGAYALTGTVTLCIIGATLGNSFNGSKCFGFFTSNKWMPVYYLFISIFIFLGSVVDTPTLWDIADIILPMIVIPNLIGLIILTVKNRKDLRA